MRKLILSALLVTSCASMASAAVIVNDNFDSYANQAAFQAAWPIASTTSDTSKQSTQLSSARSVSSPNSVLVPVSTTATSTVTEYRNRRTFAETGTVSSSSLTGTFVFSFDFYDVGTTASPNPQRNYVNLQDTTAPTGTNQLVSLGLNNNQLGTASGGNYYMARILGYSPSAADPDGGPGEGTTSAGAYFKLNDFGVGLRPTSAAWTNLKVVISTNDGLSTDYEFYVNNVLAERVSNVGTTASLRSYDNITMGSGLTNGVVANFDNMYLAAIPEPATMVLLGLGSLMLRRRRTA